MKNTDLPRYIIFENPQGSYSILKRVRRREGDVYSVHMPDLGSRLNANFVLEAILDREESNRIENERRNEAFEAEMKKPHEFILTSRDSSLCYCGGGEFDEIHILEKEEKVAHLGI